MLRSAHSCRQETGRQPIRHHPERSSPRPEPVEGRRGSTLAAALALAFLIFAITTVCLARMTASYAQIRMRHNQASALFLAEAGIQKAASSLLTDRSYAGEERTRLPTGSFDVTVTRAGGGYVVTSTGYPDTPFKHKPHKTVRATITITGAGSFRMSDWRDNP